MDEKNRPRVHHQFGLHIQSPWRITTTKGLFVAYRDMADPPSDVSPEDFDPNEAPRTRRDELLDEFVSGPPLNPRVLRVSASAYGDLAIDFDGPSRLETFRDHATLRTHEDWRLLTPDGHWVFEGGRLDFISGPDDDPQGRPGTRVQ